MMESMTGCAVGHNGPAILIGQTVIAILIGGKATGGEPIFLRELDIFMAPAAGFRNMFRRDA